MERLFFDSVSAAVTHLETEDAANGTCFADAIKVVDLSDAQQTLSFLTPQLLRVRQGVYMVRYPMADYGEFMPIDTTGTIWSAGSIYFSGDIAGKPEWYSALSDDMPYADFSEAQFLQENHMAAIGYKWNRMDLERARELGINPIARKADAASKTGERFIHKVAMFGDGAKFATGFINDPLMTTTSGAAITDTSTALSDVAVVNNALTSVETNTKETFRANAIAFPTSIYNILASKQMPGTGMTVLGFLRTNSVIGSEITLKRTRHLETAGAGGLKRLIAYANDPDAHEFHLPGGGHQFFQEWQKGPFSWEVPGVMNIGGYDNHIPKAKTAVDIAAS